MTTSTVESPHQRIVNRTQVLLIMTLRQLFSPLLLPFATASPATISPIRTRTAPLLKHSLGSILHLSIIVPTVIRFNVPSILIELWESILRAVPKKKTSHRKKRQRFMAGKALKDVTALNKCSACGNVKRAHLLCPFCVNGLYQPSPMSGICQANILQRSEICGAKRDRKSRKKRQQRRTHNVNWCTKAGLSIWRHSVVNRSIGLASSAKGKRLQATCISYSDHNIAFFSIYKDLSGSSEYYNTRQGMIFPSWLARGM